MSEQVQSAKVPAVILPRQGAAWKVAGVSVLDRLVVALHRGGAGRIIVVGENFPELKRSKALGIAFDIVPAVPEGLQGKVLLARANLLVQAVDVRRCLEANASLLKNGKPVGFGVVQNTPPESSSVEDVPRADGSPAAFDRGPTEFAAEKGREIEATGVVAVVFYPEDRIAAEKALWATMWSNSDGFVDTLFNRPVGRLLSKVLIFTPVSPNMVSIASILIGLIAALFLAEGSYQNALLGAILFQISAIVDCVDGDIARMLFKESPLGKWIDLVGDQVVHISVFAGITLGVLRNGGDKQTLWLGLSAVVGALLSFIVVLRGMKQPADPSGRLQKLIDGATSRDFSVIVLVLAYFQKLPWFLWMAGIGSHLFWIAALGLQLASKPRGRTPPAR
jgi:phosphatidylglycerophosphate synthase